MIKNFIIDSTKRNDVVLDPFGGVGTTACACKLLQRKCLSIELSPKWHRIVQKRVNLCSPTWRTTVEYALYDLGSTASLKQIYEIILSPPRDRKTIHNKDPKAKIRQTLNRYSRSKIKAFKEIRPQVYKLCY